MIREKLEKILENSKIDHKIEIIKQAVTLKDAHIYCKINELSGQVAGPLIENYIKHKYDMTKNKSSLCIGDVNCKDRNIEIKMSNGGQENNKFNYVQLRMNHDCDYLLTAYYINYSNLADLGELFIFRLNKNDMKSLLLKYGSYAHGSIKKLGPITEDELNDVNNKKEYALRPVYDSELWKNLIKFRIDEDQI